jgi:hypothetical protein
MADGSLQGYESLRRRIAAISGPVLGKSIMAELGRKTVLEAGKRAPHKTGNLRRSMNPPGGIRNLTDTSVEIVAQANYANAVEFGAKPHIIRPTAARIAAGKNFLAWASSSSKGFSLSGRPSAAKGNVVGYTFAAIVHHPGNRAQPFLRPGAEAAIEGAGIADRIVSAWNKAG